MGTQTGLGACRPLTFHGAPYPLSTRVALKRQLAEAEKLGFGFDLGIECEIFLLKQAADGTLATPDATDRLVKPCYDLRGFLGNFGWLDKMASGHRRARLGPLLVRP